MHKAGSGNGGALTPDGAQAVARELAGALATDVVERESAGKAPVREVHLLREAGLLPLLLPAEHGGAGLGWDTAYAVVRTVTAGDPPLGQLLGDPYPHSLRVPPQPRPRAPGPPPPPPGPG